jgi:hypothetical protein
MKPKLQYSLGLGLSGSVAERIIGCASHGGTLTKVEPLTSKRVRVLGQNGRKAPQSLEQSFFACVTLKRRFPTRFLFRC